MKKFSSVFVIFILLSSFFPPVLQAQQAPAVIQQGDLEYLGSFRLPRDMAPASYLPNAYPTEFQNQDALDFGGGIIGLDTGRGELVVSTRRNRVVSVSIPTPVKASSITNLPFATYRSNFVSPTGGETFNQLGDPDSPASLYGGIIQGDRIITTGIIYYDANNSQRRGHIVSSWPPQGMNVQVATPWRTVASETKQGLVAGYMAPVPAAWQTRLKGTVVSGQAGVPIITRTSAGPAIYSFDPSRLLVGASTDVIPATELLAYPSGHHTLAPWEGASPIYGGTTSISGVALIDNTALFLGSNGLGYWCYGNGTSNLSLHNTIGTDGERNCYDPSNSSKAQHAYPMRTQMWAYPLEDLARVANGEIAPWSLTPTYWGLTLPFSSDSLGYLVKGMAYDESERKLYISQFYTDVDGYSSRALIHIYKVNSSSSSSPPPPLPPPPTPTPLLGDINLDRVINTLDWSLMNAAWFTNNLLSDLNQDGQVNSLDFATLSSRWGMTW